MVQGRTQLALAGVVLFASGAFAGFVADTLVFRRSPGTGRKTPSAALVSTPDVRDEIAPALAKLSEVLASLREVLEQPRPPRTEGLDRIGQRTPIGEPDPSVDSKELASALNALAAAVRRMPRSGDSSRSATENLVVPSWVDRKRAFSSYSHMLRTAELTDDEETIELATRSLARAHMFWSRQAVLDSYGAPDEIYNDDVENIWSYTIRNEEAKLTENFDFHFYDGAVTTVGYDSWN